MSPEAELAEMRRQYEYAERETHMLVDGKLRLRCRDCGVQPIPSTARIVLLCDTCLNVRLVRLARAKETS